MNLLAAEMVEKFDAINKDINHIGEYLGFKLSEIESVQDTFNKNEIFVFNRPDSLEGIFAYVTTQKELTPETRADRFKKFFNQASRAMSEQAQTSNEVDFIIVIGRQCVIFFDSADYRRRLILTADKLSRENSKYLKKFDSLKSEYLIANQNYKEDDFFGDIQLASEFKTELFRFAIGDDEQFVARTKTLRLNFWKKIREDSKCQKIIKQVFFKNSKVIDETTQYYADVISAVLDTLVLRYLLVRILEGRFGYETEYAKKSVSKIGLGTSIDKTLESKVQFNQQLVEEYINSKKEQLSLFDIEAYEIDEKAVSKIHKNQVSFMEEVYGGDLYVSDIAKAATQIEKALTEQEYALIWNLTSSTNRDFDLADITPGTIGEQYEQTLKMSLVKDTSGKWEYSKDNSHQRELGAFYTNAKITDYIIDITLGKKLTEIKAAVLEASETQKVKALKSVLNMRMADISSGGGTFLAGAVRKLGDWYRELEKMPDIQPIMLKIKELSSIIDFQKYAVNHMIYGIDVDLKALIVSSFALTLESLGDTQDKLPELIGKTLINQNSVISLVPESQKLTWFDNQKQAIKELFEEKKKWTSKKGNEFLNKKSQLQQAFSLMAAEYLATKKNPQVVFEQIFIEKNMRVLEFELPEVFFDKDGNYSGGFDIIFGNPPYIQLQKKEIFSDLEKEIYKRLGEFHSYAATGDIYALFFERALKLLKPGGRLGFITSNKYLRAGYGKSLRNYLIENTNPYLLVNLGSGMFGATVDTSILAVEKSENKKEFKAIDLAQRAREPRERIENMSDYIEQHQQNVFYEKDESWIILSPIEQSIKEKIEAVGTPLKDWDISINYGIKTGFNEAFIISGEKRQEILENCQSDSEREKTAELIRPMLRGRDIKKYSYDFANLYLIYVPWHFPLQNDNSIQGASQKAEKLFEQEYPAVYNHLLGYKEQLSERNKAETGIRYEWYALQRWGSNYWDDFNKPHIVWKAVGKKVTFCILEAGKYLSAPASMIVSDNNEWLLAFLQSQVGKYFFLNNSDTTGAGDLMLNIQSLVKFPVPLPIFDFDTESLIKEKLEQRLFDDIENIIFGIYGFTDKEIHFISSSVNL